MNWYVGQKVVCIMDGTWGWEGTGPDMLGPEEGDIVTVDSWGYSDGCTWLRLREWTGPLDEYDSIEFRPLNITEQLERIESEGAPVEQPEPQHA